jgi:hypothetical protein
MIDSHGLHWRKHCALCTVLQNTATENKAKDEHGQQLLVKENFTIAKYYSA